MKGQLNKVGIDIRNNTDRHSVFTSYIVGYIKAVKNLGEELCDYCCPITKRELQLLVDGNGTFRKLTKDIYHIVTSEGEIDLGLEDAE